MTTEMSKLYEGVGFSLQHMYQTDSLNMGATKAVYAIMKDGQWHPIGKIKEVLKHYNAGLRSVVEALLIAEDSKGKYLCIDKGVGITPEYSPAERLRLKQKVQRMF